MAAQATVAPPRSVLVVGGGPTAALAAASLKQLCLQRNVVPPKITIMDKARGFGGRMSTHKASGAAAGAHADTGAQYLTELSENSKRWFDQLKAQGVIVPMVGDIVGQKATQKTTANYVAPQGISSVVRSIAASSGAHFLPSHRVVALNVVDNPDLPEEEEEEEGADDGSPKRQWSVLVEKVSGPASRGAAPAAAAGSGAASGAGAVATPGRASSPKAGTPGASSVSSATAGASSSSSVSSAAGSSASAAAGPSSSLSSAAAASTAPPLEKFVFDAVVLTCPVPQLLSLEGDVRALLEGAEVVEGLRQVTYSSRYSLILYYGPGDWAALTRALPPGAIAKYCDRSESDVIRFVSFDSAKRQRVPPEFATIPLPEGSASAPSPEPCPSVIVHTSVEFGDMYVDTDPSLVEPVILEHLKRMFPSMPEPVETRCHRWRYSQVMRGYRGHQPFGFMIKGSEESKGGLSDSHGERQPPAQEVAGALLAVDDPPLILAGDAFTASHFDGCVVSGERAASLVMEMLGSTMAPVAAAAINSPPPKGKGDEEEADADDK